MATTDLQFYEPGTLPRPGPIGRALRGVFGVLCGWLLIELIRVSNTMVDADGDIEPLLVGAFLPGLFLISYVVNIGFSRDWKKWPAMVSASVPVAVGGVSFLIGGTAQTLLLASPLWAWEFYIFSHLGLSFFLAAILGTPGCEMRALPDLYSRITGIPVKEHRCPIGPLNPVDRWESSRR